MASKYHKVTLSNSCEEIKIFVKHSMNILDRINELFQQKFKGDIKQLAEKMEESEKQVEEWLNGVQNYSLQTISKFESVFDESIIKIIS